MDDLDGRARRATAALHESVGVDVALRARPSRPRPVVVAVAVIVALIVVLVVVHERKHDTVTTSPTASRHLVLDQPPDGYALTTTQDATYDPVGSSFTLYGAGGSRAPFADADLLVWRGAASPGLGTQPDCSSGCFFTKQPPGVVMAARQTGTTVVVLASHHFTTSELDAIFDDLDPTTGQTLPDELVPIADVDDEPYLLQFLDGRHLETASYTGPDGAGLGLRTWVDGPGVLDFYRWYFGADAQDVEIAGAPGVAMPAPLTGAPFLVWVAAPGVIAAVGGPAGISLVDLAAHTRPATDAEWSAALPKPPAPAAGSPIITGTFADGAPWRAYLTTDGRACVDTERRDRQGCELSNVGSWPQQPGDSPLAYGTPFPGTATVTFHLSDGTSASAAVQDGLYAIELPNAAQVVQIEFLDANGAPVGAG